MSKLKFEALALHDLSLMADAELMKLVSGKDVTVENPLTSAAYCKFGRNNLFSRDSVKEDLRKILSSGRIIFDIERVIGGGKDCVDTLSVYLKGDKRMDITVTSTLDTSDIMRWNMVEVLSCAGSRAIVAIYAESGDLIRYGLAESNELVASSYAARNAMFMKLVPELAFELESHFKGREDFCLGIVQAKKSISTATMEGDSSSRYIAFQEGKSGSSLPTAIFKAENMDGLHKLLEEVGYCTTLMPDDLTDVGLSPVESIDTINAIKKEHAELAEAYSDNELFGSW